MTPVRKWESGQRSYAKEKEKDVMESFLQSKLIFLYREEISCDDEAFTVPLPVGPFKWSQVG